MFRSFSRIVRLLDGGDAGGMTTDNDIYLVLGGTGKTGRRVTRGLTTAGHTVRAASRSTTPRFDWHDDSTWDAVLAGATAVYLPPPDEPFPVEEFVTRAVTAGVRRFVALSGRRMQLLDPEGVSPMRRTEEAVKASGVAWTILQANNFHQNFSEGDYLDAVLAGELVLPLGEAVEPLIDVADIAEIAVLALTTGDHDGRLYELTGPQALTYGQVAAVLTEAIGKPVVFRDIAPERYLAKMREQRLPEPLIEFLDGMYATMRDGVIADVSDDARTVLGREPVDFATWAKQTAAEGAWN